MVRMGEKIASAILDKTPIYKIKIELKPAKKFRWIYNRIVRHLFKVGILKYENSIDYFVYEYTRKVHDNLRDLYLSHIDQWDYRFDPEKYVFVIGPKEFDQMRYEDSREQQFLFSHKGASFGINIGYNGRYMNVPVYVVPTLSGAALIPKVIIEERKNKYD